MEHLRDSSSKRSSRFDETPQKSVDCGNTSLSRAVRLVVRVRPFLSHEITPQNSVPISCISVLDQNQGNGDEVAVYLKDPQTNRKECYQLDSFFDQEDGGMRQIFDKELYPLVLKIFHGCNSTVFAYGATGSGKTYTMQGTDDLPGLMPLAMSAVLSLCGSMGCTAEISYYEVYLEKCIDLLEVKATEIAILEDKDGQIHLRGLSRVPVRSMSEFFETFSCGVQRRKMAHTGLNDISSRSHAVLVISVSSPSADGSRTSVTGKINLIDLAGNENNRRTNIEGLRLPESGKINQSLFALSNVIYALNNKQPRVPYRESKLTRILQDSLGGKSRALVVACLKPGEYQESVHTISLTARSRHITCVAQKIETPPVKVDMEAKLQAWLESKGKERSVKRTLTLSSPFPCRTPGSVNSVKKKNCYTSAKSKLNINHGVNSAEQRNLCTSSRNLFSQETTLNSQLEKLNFGDAKNEEETCTWSNTMPSESETSIRDEASNKEEYTSNVNSAKFVESTPIHERHIEQESSLRNALTPINMNSKSPAELSSAKTLKTPLKFNTALRNSLIQEYIGVLNTASREELLELKGIGEKLSSYIIEVRDKSPLKSLNDLQKIGLSSKQVQNMFSKATTCMLEE